MRTPTRFSVSGLHGNSDEFHVDFPLTDEFRIIYGVNGVGKTRFLETIRALSVLNVVELSSMIFLQASVDYDDLTSLKVVKRPEGGLEFGLLQHGKSDVWTTSEDEISEKTVRAGGADWVQVEPGVWLDPSDGERIDDGEMRMRYGVRALELYPRPPAFDSYIQGQETHFIRTQRLLESGGNRRRSTLRYRGRNQSQTTVTRYAREVTDQLREALTANSRTTATLDRTFPNRLLTDSDKSPLRTDQIRERYETQNQKRERLARFSLIGPESDLALPARELQDWERRVLQTYLEDTEKKLNTFDGILAKVELLEDIINRRFHRKSIRISAEEGLLVSTEDGNRILPQDLSSGEQHELIMFYDMLFNVSPGAMVLIDEPEISLHVAWQREYLNDMLRVAQLSACRMLIATHSPQIIGKWRSRTSPMPLGGQPGEFDL